MQLAKALGADLMIATTTSDTKADALTAVGADVVVNTTAEDLAEIVTRATGGTGVDIVLDHVGGELFSRLFAATRVGGTIINIGRLAGPKATIDLDELSFRRLRVLGTTFSIRTAEERGEVAAALVPEVLPAVADGRVRPVVDSVFPFEEAKRACARQQIERRVERRYRGSQGFFRDLIRESVSSKDTSCQSSKSGTSTFTTRSTVRARRRLS